MAQCIKGINTRINSLVLMRNLCCLCSCHSASCILKQTCIMHHHCIILHLRRFSEAHQMVLHIGPGAAKSNVLCIDGMLFAPGAWVKTSSLPPRWLSCGHAPCDAQKHWLAGRINRGAGCQYEHFRAFISYNCSTYDFIWYYMALKRYFSKIGYYSGLPVEVMDYKLWNPNTGNQAITRTIKNLSPIFAAEPSVPGVERQPAPAPPAYPSGHIWAHRLPNAATKTVWPVSNYWTIIQIADKILY